MRVTTLSRVVLTISASTLIGACQDSFSPGPNEPSTEGLTVVPSSATIQAGHTVALKATLIDEHGDKLAGVPISWKSSNDAVATVAASGEVFGRGAGSAVITASAMGKSQISTIRVTPRALPPDKTGKQPKQAI